MTLGQLVLGYACGQRLALGDPGDSIEQLFARCVGIAPHGDLQRRLIGNDVVLGPGLETAPPSPLPDQAG